MIKTSTGQKIGLWQDPSQFAAAMAYHGSSRHEIRSYIEVSLCIDLSLSLPRPRPRPDPVPNPDPNPIPNQVGCYTGWTALILTTYLQRIGHRVRCYLIKPQ